MNLRDQRFSELREQSVSVDGETVVYRYARHLTEDGIALPRREEVAALYRAALAAGRCPPGGPLAIAGEDLLGLRAGGDRRFPREE